MWMQMRSVKADATSKRTPMYATATRTSVDATAKRTPVDVPLVDLLSTLFLFLVPSCWIFSTPEPVGRLLC